MAAGGGLLRLPHRIPYQKALELALTGDSFTAEEAASWGFVNVLTEPGEALAGALALAERITKNGPLAVAVTKEIIVKSAEWSEAEMWKKQQRTHHARVLVEGRDGGCDRLRREARAELDRVLTV